MDASEGFMLGSLDSVRRVYLMGNNCTILGFSEGVGYGKLGDLALGDIAEAPMGRFGGSRLLG